jgi:hypothetical protein
MKIHEIVSEDITAGAIGSVAMPFFKPHRSRKKRSTRNVAGEGMMRRVPVPEATQGKKKHG